MRRMFDGEEGYSVYEVFYDGAGRIQGWSENSQWPSGSSPKELKKAFEFYANALAKPILDWKTGKEIPEKKNRRKK